MVELKKMTAPKLDDFYEDKRDGVFYISHASILVRLSGKYFLFDPVLAKPPHLGSWLFFPEMVLDKRLLEVDAVFVSHQHLDHCDTDFLNQLPKSTPVYILAGRPQFKEIFDKDGVVVTELPENTLTDLGNDIKFIGVEHEYNKIDSGLAISNGNLTVYHGNDCFVSNEKLAIIKKAFPVMDVACVPFAYVHWYPFLMDEVDEGWKKSEADRLIEKYLEYGVAQVRFLEPKIAIPFGANMFYFDEVESDHNKAVLTPFDFKDYADKSKFELAEVINPLFAGDFLFKDDGANKLEVHRAPFSLAQLKENLGQFIRKMRLQGNGWDLSFLDDVPNKPNVDLEFINDRLRKFPVEQFDHNVYISNRETGGGYIEVDLLNWKASFKENIDVSRPYHHFKLTDLAFRAYLSHEFSFNEMVASSQFRLSRNPNEYNLSVLNVVNNII